METKIQVDVFVSHLERLANLLDKDQDAFFFLSGKEEGSTKPKTKAMYIWLMGFDMIETIFVVTRKSIIYLASSKKITMLDEAKARLGKYNLLFLPKVQVNTESFQKIVAQIKQETGRNNLNIAMLTKEKQTGAFAQEWADFLKSNQNIQQVDSSLIVSQLLSLKDNSEIQYVQQSAQFTVYLTKKLISHIENSIDQNVKVKHLDLANKIEGILDNATEREKMMKQLKLPEGGFDLGYSPIIQSGGTYSLSPNATSNNQQLSTDVIILQVGGQVNVYNTSLSRTLFIDPSDRQKKIYNLSLEIQTKVCSSLSPGRKLSEIYKECRDMWVPKKEELQLPDFPSYLGYGIGIEFRESALLINDKNDRVVEKNLVFFVLFAVENLPNGQKGINYVVSLGDTVLVEANGPANLTQTVAKLYKNVSYQLQDDGEQPEVQPKQKQTQQQSTTQRTNNNEPQPSSRSRGTRNQQIQQQRQNEQQRQKHQLELNVAKQSDLQDRLEADGFTNGSQQNKSLELGKLNCYRQVEQMPKDIKKGQIFIDHQRQAILLPINGVHIPFHVSCIKNVSKIDEGKIGASLRINFFTNETSNGNIVFPEFDGQVLFIKELQFRSRTITRLQELIVQIKALQKKVRTEQQVERERATTGEIEPLIVNRTGRKPVFKDLKIRPTMASGRSTGVLELHLNGFRYIYNNRDTIDIPFKNIKHYIFQSPEHEIIAAFHFHLISPIILGKKKTSDVQFYSEVGGGVEHLEGRKKQTRNDDDEMDDEDRQRQQRRKMHKEFEAFIKSVEETAKEFNIVFEKPYRELGFEGNWNRARIYLQPTFHTLMNVIETPFFILTLNEVEIACFERVMPGIKSFDLVFVFKNYDRQVLRVESIDMKDLEGVKNWLDKMNILFFEVGSNLVWKNVLGTIQKDIAGFIDDGGWGTVLGDSDNEEEGEDEVEQGDSEFAPDNTDEESEFSEGDDDDDDVDENGDDDDDDDSDASVEDVDEDDLSDVIDLNNISENEESMEEEDSQRKQKKPMASNGHNNHNKNQNNQKRNPARRHK